MLANYTQTFMPQIVGAARVAGRVFAEKPKAFRRRIVALWGANGVVRVDKATALRCPTLDEAQQT